MKQEQEVISIEDAETLKIKEHEAYCVGLEELALFLRQHPTLPLPSPSMLQYVYDGKAAFASVVRKLGTSEKEYTNWTINVFKKFGPIQYGVYCARESVCEKVVVGKKTVPLQPSYYSAEVPEHEEDVIEWKCGSILDAEEKPSETA